MAIKTLHLTNAWHEQSGGVATFYRALLDAANRRRQPIRLIVPGAENRVEEAGAYGRIYFLAARPAPLNPAYRMIFPNRFLLPGSAIQRILAAERPELVEICDKYCLNYLGPLLRLRLLKEVELRPVVVGLSCERMDQNLAVYLHQPAWGRRFAALYMHYLYFPFFDHHITVSEHTADELKAAAGAGHMVKRGVWVRPMGVDFQGFSPDKASAGARAALVERVGGRPDSRLLLYVGRLAPEKNLALLIEMMAQLQADDANYRLVLAGDGIEREALAAAAAQRAPGRVSLLGHVGEREALSRIYANSDLFLHPNANEPFGIAPLEAMASGLPVVAPDSGGIKSYANQENAFLVEGTAAAFAAAVRRAMASPELRRAKAAAARATAEQFSWPAVTDSFLELYDTIHAVGTGKLSIAEAAPAFCSTAAAPRQATAQGWAARTARAGFLFYSSVAGRLRRAESVPEASARPQ
jgi:alpha-1,6-mannosyltransferase